MANDNDTNSNHSIATTVEKIEVGGRKGEKKKKKKKRKRKKKKIELADSFSI